jgi:hypothetical protein
MGSEAVSAIGLARDVNAMPLLSRLPLERERSVRAILTDIDDTIAPVGMPTAYAALENLQRRLASPKAIQEMTLSSCSWRPRTPNPSDIVKP